MCHKKLHPEWNLFTSVTVRLKKWHQGNKQHGKGGTAWKIWDKLVNTNRSLLMLLLHIIKPECP